MFEVSFGVFARGGSKSIPNKNLLKIGKFTLLENTIFQAKRICKSLGISEDKVYVSTDSPSIREVAKKSGANVPLLRPEVLAKDDSPELLAWKHMVQNFLGIGIEQTDHILVVLPVTSPLRRDEDIIGSLKKFQDCSFDLVFSGTVARKNPYFNMFELKSNGTVTVSKHSKKISRRQDAPQVFENNNAVYVAKTNYILETPFLFQGKVGIYMMPQENSIDIDSPIDFEIARYLWQINRGC